MNIGYFEAIIPEATVAMKIKKTFLNIRCNRLSKTNCF